MIKQKTKIIRPLKAEDYPQWLPLWQLYVRVGQEAVPGDATQLTWQRIIAVPPVIHGLGYFADRWLLGFAHYHCFCHANVIIFHLRRISCLFPKIRLSGAGS